MYLYGLQMDKQTYNPTNEHTLTKMSILESDKHKWNEIKKKYVTYFVRDRVVAYLRFPSSQ